MNVNLRKIRDVTLAFLLGAVPAGNALADDIEIYVGADNDLGGVPPNILFIIDTSGSMQGIVENDQAAYDPAIDYPGTCQDDRIYWSSRSNFPTCGTSQYVPLASFHCEAATDAFTTVGYFQDRFGSWRDSAGTNNDYWTDVDRRYQDRLTECKADQGVHGNGGAELYAADRGNGPWSATAAHGTNWNNRDVLTVMSGNYLNWWNNPPPRSTLTRLAVVQDVTKNLLDSVANVNVGLMRYSSDAAGGMILYPVEDVTAHKTAMKTSIDTLQPLGGTPLSETFYEAIQYFRGKNVDFGLDSKVSTTTVPSVAESRGNGDADLADAEDSDYRSPIAFQCQKNFIIYLTDGEPTSDSHAGSKIKAWPGFAGSGTCSDSISGDCMEEASYYARNRDLRPDMNGDQNVITYVVGFDLQVDKLVDTAKAGGGKFYLADDSQSLLSAFTDIVNEILAINTTFTAPAVSVNAFNRTVHLDQLFFTVFKPSDRPHWNGNMKRFDLGFASGSTELEILDANDNPAVDPNTGFFRDTAVSYWTLSDQTPDGGEAKLGGAAGKLGLTRNIYTYTGNEAALTNTPNRFHESNTGITKALLDIAAQTDTYRTKLLQWARGVDLNDDDDDGLVDDARRIMGDPLHSKPVVVTYGGTVENPDFTVFMTTNDGFLHAINGATGDEHFSFIPQETWPNLHHLYEDNPGVNNKAYGLDSPITAWTKDLDGDGVIESVDGDRVYIFFGQRRGGKNYYALDVTNRAAPSFLWRRGKTSTGYGELGQTWSQPRVAKVKVGATDKIVLIFGGGYDEDQDGADIYLDDDEGRAIYMVDALTGAIIWRAGPTGSGANLELAAMESSIPAKIRVVDMNADGYSDRMYASDVGGRIFRFDILNGQPAASLVTGGMIASLGAGDDNTPTAANSRKFFYPPDAAIIVDGSRRFINLAIGSGNQDHPLGRATTDRLYSVRDWNVYNVPAAYTQEDGTVITVDDLYDATDNLIQQGTDAQKSAAIETLNSKDGWYIDLENVSTGAIEGEKSLSEATTAQGRIFYTTFTPISAGQTNSCAPSQGIARVYAIDAVNGGAVQNFDDLGTDDALTRDDRAMNLTRGGIPPEVTILFPESNDGKPAAFAGPERLPLNLTNPPVRTYWYEAGAAE